MRGLSYLERRALVVDASADGECIPGAVFEALVRSGRGRWVRERWWRFWEMTFEATPAGALAIRVCPVEPGH